MTLIHLHGHNISQQAVSFPAHVNHFSHFVFLCHYFHYLPAKSFQKDKKNVIIAPLAASFLNAKIKDAMFKGAGQMGHAAGECSYAGPAKPPAHLPHGFSKTQKAETDLRSNSVHLGGRPKPRHCRALSSHFHSSPSASTG